LTPAGSSETDTSGSAFRLRGLCSVQKQRQACTDGVVVGAIGCAAANRLQRSSRGSFFRADVGRRTSS
jgi:hypothetical protein